MIKFMLLIAFGAIFGLTSINADDANKCKPVLKCNKPNEEYQECPKGCPYGVCGINDAAVTCAPVDDGTCLPPACKCKSGTYRDNKGNCVEFDQCPQCNKPNEIYDPCYTGCLARRCDVDDSLKRCAAPPPIGSPDCLSGCRCADGFSKNGTDICIPVDQCPKKPLNEVTL